MLNFYVVKHQYDKYYFKILTEWQVSPQNICMHQVGPSITFEVGQAIEQARRFYLLERLFYLG